jgi:hypothetical protein
MRQSFRLLVTGSRTWDDDAVIEHALAAVLARHPEGVLLVHGACPRGADAIAVAGAARTLGFQVEAHPADWHRYGRVRGNGATARWLPWKLTAVSRSCVEPAPALPPRSGQPGPQASRYGSHARRE